MFGNLGNLTGLFKAARELQDQVARMQEEMGRRRFEAEAGGGLVKAVVTGRGQLVDLHIDPKAVEDVELLEDLVKAAVGAAVEKSQEAWRSEMASLTGGMNLPGLAEMFGAAAPKEP